MGKVEGLNSKGVAGKEERLVGRVPERKGEHAPEPLQRLPPPLREGGKQHLRVAVCAKAPSGGLQFRLKLAKIVDGAVEDDRVAAVGRDHGLLAVYRVEYRQPPHADRGGTAACHSGIVRSPVNHRGAHPQDGLLPFLGRSGDVYESGYPAHGLWISAEPDPSGTTATGSFLWSRIYV